MVSITINNNKFTINENIWNNQDDVTAALGCIEHDRLLFRGKDIAVMSFLFRYFEAPKYNMLMTEFIMKMECNLDPSKLYVY